MKKWKLTCTKETLNTLKHDEKFIAMLPLARCMNALLFCLGILILNHPQKSVLGDKPHSNNEEQIKLGTKFNSFLFICSILYEGFLLIEKITKDFKNDISFKEGFRKLLKDKNIQNFRNNVLKIVRNKYVFHFDKNVEDKDVASGDSLEKFLQLDLHRHEYSFASGTDFNLGGTYFDLVDEIMIHNIIKAKPNESNEILTKRYREILKQTEDIMVQFIESATELLTDNLTEMGFSVEFYE